MVMTEYEKQRWERIQQNRKKIEDLGVNALAFETKCLMKDSKRQGTGKMESNKVFAKNDEYKPNEESELDESNEDTDNETMANSRILRSCSKKILASGGRNLVKNVEKPQKSAPSMTTLFNMRSQTHKDKEEQREGKTQVELNSLQIKKKEKTLISRGQQELSQKNGGVSSVVQSQQRVSMTSEKMMPQQSQQEKEVESNTLAKKEQSKRLIAPGSVSAYARMKEVLREKERLSKQNDSLPKEPIQVRNLLSFDLPMEGAPKQQKSYSEVQLGDKLHLIDEDEGLEDLDDYASEKEKYDDLEEIEDDVAKIINESIPDKDQQIDQHVLQKEKRKRGPSMCKDVRGWTIDDRKPIILNGKGQPIGPDKATLDKFSRFLGSLARDPDLAPLNELSWHQVPNKDNIWDYVKTKYMIVEAAKSYVLRSVGDFWRVHKYKVKLHHYHKYDNDADRRKNKPKTVPEDHFEDLLDYWNLEEVQKISEQNRKHREGQKDRHTVGPTTFARRRYELEQVENKPISDALMYRETRKRKPEREYKTSHELVDHNIDHKRVVGRCAKRMKMPSKSDVLIPDEFLLPFKAQIVNDTIAGVAKIFKQQLPPEMLATTAPLFGDPSSVSKFANQLINGQSSGGINDIVECQDDTDREDGANDVNEGTYEGANDDIEGNCERIVNKEQDHEDH